MRFVLGLKYPLMGGDDGNGNGNGGTDNGDGTFGRDLGKAVGGAFGASVAGPVGGVLGGAIGGGVGGLFGGGDTSGATSTSGRGDTGGGFAEAIGTGIGAIGGALIQRGSAKEQAEIQANAARQGISEQEAARLFFQERTQPFLDVGLAGGQQLQDFLGAPQIDTTQRLQSFLDDPTQQLAEINPVIDFLRQQGFEQIQESAAAQGRLGAGGTLQDLTRFDVGLTSTVVPQLQEQQFNQLFNVSQLQNQLQNDRFNQLFNVAGLGANVASGQGVAALKTGTNISNLLSTAGQAQATGVSGREQATLGLIENLSSIPGAFPNLFGQQQRAGGPAPVSDLSFTPRPATSTQPSF